MQSQIFSQHKHNIITQKDSAISNHFNQADHNISMLKITIIQAFTANNKYPEKTDNLRKKNELQ